MELKDGMGRKINYLRLSVTDRCNQRCIYCMPEEGIEHFSHDYLLRLEELADLTRRFVDLLGIDKVRLTGGEPLIRKNIEGLVGMLAEIQGIKDLTMTTNGVLLAEKSSILYKAGLKRLNVSIDSLNPDRYRTITRRDDLQEALDGLMAAREVGFSPIKVNVVLLPDFDEEARFVEWANREGFRLRFIELMPHFHSGKWDQSGDGIKEAEILKQLSQRFGRIQEFRDESEERGKHVRSYRIPDRNWEFEIIPGVSNPFCGDCNRLRIDCQGTLRLCLYSDHILQLKPYLDTTDEEFISVIKRFVERKTERMLDHIGSNMSAIGG